MMKQGIIWGAIPLSLIVAAMPAVAQDALQTTTQPAAAQAVLLASPNDTVLRAGTAVPLRMMEALTTKGKKLKPGYRFNLEVADDVLLNGAVVIPRGSPAVGEITDVRNKGMWGKSGKINARILYVRVQGRQIRLTGQFDDKGVTGTAGVVGAIAFVPIAGFFMTGTSAKIDQGANINAFLDEDIAIAAPTPVVVTPAAAPVAQPAAEPTAEPAPTPAPTAG